MGTRYHPWLDPLRHPGYGAEAEVIETARMAAAGPMGADVVSQQLYDEQVTSMRPDQLRDFGAGLVARTLHDHDQNQRRFTVGAGQEPASDADIKEILSSLEKLSSVPPPNVHSRPLPRIEPVDDGDESWVWE